MTRLDALFVLNNIHRLIANMSLSCSGIYSIESVFAIILAYHTDEVRFL